MIVGVDVSSRRIDLAWVQDGKPQRWHQELAKGHLIDRLRSIRVQWPSDGQVMRQDVTDIAIEYPFGRGNAIAALMATTGIITRQAPPWARVAWPSAGELRAAIGATKNTKQSAHEMIIYGNGSQWSGPGIYPWMVTPYELRHWDEHELDALVACIGWTRILQAQDDAA